MSIFRTFGIERRRCIFNLSTFYEALAYRTELDNWEFRLQNVTNSFFTRRRNTRYKNLQLVVVVKLTLTLEWYWVPWYRVFAFVSKNWKRKCCNFKLTLLLDKRKNLFTQREKPVFHNRINLFMQNTTNRQEKNSCHKVDFRIGTGRNYQKLC